MVLPVTGALAAYIKRAGLPSERIKITPNGVDTEKFRPRNTSEARARLGLGQSLVLGFVGYIREWHGLDVMIDVLARPALAHTHLLIVGNGPTLPSLKERARQLGMLERVHFTGTMPRESLPELTSCIDIALQPNVTPYASPLKLFEYMAAARAIVAPASPNIREILDDGVDGVLFAPGSAEAMAGAIERLAGDAAMRERLGKAAAQKIAGRNLTWRGNAERAVSIVRKLRASPGLAAEPVGS
jgi:glycosyltransferase involved in cell wall biosynthesis